MKTENVKFDTISQYNAAMQCETLHPLVTVTDYSKLAVFDPPASHTFGFYTVFLKEVKCGDLKYGRSYYDYQEGTLVFLAPGQGVTIENRVKHKPKGWGLMFHHELIKGTPLGRTIDSYSFFSYQVNEALHLSEQERTTILNCFNSIATEIRRPIDRHSKKLIAANIELFLNYCARYYDRQFCLRTNAHSDIIGRFETMLVEYFNSDLPQSLGLPTVKHFAKQLHLSANYLGDLLKKETGKNAQEHIQLQLIEVAKERIRVQSKNVSEVAYELGFQYPQYFSRMFKKHVGTAPTEYRHENRAEH